MADNTVLDLGSGGDTIATDDIGGVKHQRVKLETGADGVAVDVGGNAYNADAITAPTTAILLNALAALVALAPDGAIDRVRLLGNTAGTGLGVIAAAPWIPGASDLLTARLLTVSNSTTRVTLATPTTGKKIRIVAAFILNGATVATRMELYFGTGANIGTDTAKYIAETFADRDTIPDAGPISFPDGGGPVGAVDDVISMRTTSNITTSGAFGVLYREE